MTQFPDTQNSLIAQVQDPQNAAAWEQFTQLYQPVIYRLARQRGLQDADSHDLSQQVLMAVAAAIREWEDRGEDIRFRHWLRRIAHNAIVNALTRRPRDVGIGGSSIQQLLVQQPGGDILQKQLDLEYRREIYRQASAEIRHDVQPETWMAFQLSVIDGLSIEATAQQIGKPVGTVYAARSRVMRRLQDTVRKFDD